MRKLTRKILLLGILVSIMQVSFADRGIGKKSKSKILLNINTNNSFKNSISFNLKTGLKYTGSLLANVEMQNNSLISTELVTFQKGNSIYIVPTKQKVIVPEIKQGYSGLKIIIKTK